MLTTLIDSAYPRFLPVLHCLPTSNDRDCPQVWTASVHYIHRHRLGPHHGRTRSRQDLEADAGSAYDAGIARGRLLLDGGLFGQYMVH